MSRIMYLCNRKRCERCRGEKCRYTPDRRYAVHKNLTMRQFRLLPGGDFWEIDDGGEEDQKLQNGGG